MEEADLIILILNQAEALKETDKELLKATQDQVRIILLNKQDLDPIIMQEDLDAYLTEDDSLIMTSLLSEAGVNDLEEAIYHKFFKGEFTSTDVTYLLNSRHTQLLKQAISRLNDVIEACRMGLPIDLIQIDFTEAWNLLGEITGESVQDELITKLFSQFCLGK